MFTGLGTAFSKLLLNLSDTSDYIKWCLVRRYEGNDLAFLCRERPEFWFADLTQNLTETPFLLLLPAILPFLDCPL